MNTHFLFESRLGPFTTCPVKLPVAAKAVAIKKSAQMNLLTAL
jgi:hypothetical protein